MSNWYSRRTAQPYPTLYSPGFLSGKALGSGHSGVNPPESDGDLFAWNNSNTPFVNGPSDRSTEFHNTQPDWWKEGRDYHFVPKPGYKPYEYPDPVRRSKH